MTVTSKVGLSNPFSPQGSHSCLTDPHNSSCILEI
ncbi:hypothetical protein LINPERHAP2_LOCUS22811 [Linum perenne]